MAETMDKKRRRVFTPEQKAQGIALAKEVGFMKAAKEMRVAHSVLAGWLKKERVATPTAHPTYDDAFKKRALALADQVGAIEAGKQLGVHNATIYQWRKVADPNRPQNGGKHARSSKGASTNDTPNLEVEAFVAYTWGGLERDIKTFARSQHVPEEIVAGRLGEILRGKARGHVLRA